MTSCSFPVFHKNHITAIHNEMERDTELTLWQPPLFSTASSHATCSLRAALKHFLRVVEKFAIIDLRT